MKRQKNVFLVALSVLLCSVFFIQCSSFSPNTCSADADCNGSKCVDGACQANNGDMGQSSSTLETGALIGLGNGSSTSVRWTTVTSTGLRQPTHLGFNPRKRGELWIINAANDTFTIVYNGLQPGSRQKVYKDTSEHFMEKVQGISFSDNGNLGTCGDSTNTYNDQAAGNNFMGPVLWEATTSMLENDPTSIENTHFDMLHSTPNCMGIAAVTANQFFVFNGYNGTIDWYDFKVPHEPGGDDHSDGVKIRFSGVKVKRVAGVPSNLAFDKANYQLYVADTGNGRILRISFNNIKYTRQLQSFYRDGRLYEYSGAKVETIVSSTAGISQPSGLALFQNTLYVSDYATGKFHAFSLNGQRIRSLDSGLGARRVGGLTVGPDNKLYFVDMVGNKAVRVDP